MTASTATTEIMVFTNPDFGPSRHMTETIDDLADERPGIRVVEIDAWHDPDTLMQHDVMTVPTTIISVGGEERAVDLVFGLDWGRHRGCLPQGPGRPNFRSA